MNTYEWILVGVFGVLLAIIVVQKALRLGPTQRGVVKTLLSSCFLGGAIWGYTQSSNPADIVLVIGLAFAMVGDVFLIFMEDRKPFVAGVYAFACASITLCVYTVVRYGFNWWALLIFVILTAGNVFAQHKKVFNFGQNVVHLNVYTICVTLCGSMGMALLFQGQGLASFLYGIGCILYFVSDCLLGLYLFALRKRIVDCFNSLTYFPGMMLIGVSVLML